MFAQTKQSVAKRFPEHNLRVVGGFYFLRFLCPALVCPEGLWKEGEGKVQCFLISISIFFIVLNIVFNRIQTNLRPSRSEK